MRTFLKHPVLFAVLFLAGAVGLVGCDSTEPEETGGEEELITRVVLTLSAVDRAEVVATAEDNDADGLIDEIGDLELAPNTTYTGTVELFNDTETPPEDITEEVEEEDYAHQFQYEVVDLADRLAVTDLNEDRNGVALGTTFTLTVAGDEAGTGALIVRLRHYDEATPDDPTAKEADAGENDVQVTFPITILP